jgi:hypothetical protein
MLVRRAVIVSLLGLATIAGLAPVAANAASASGTREYGKVGVLDCTDVFVDNLDARAYASCVA